MYDYQTVRPDLFTEEGQVLFITIRDRVHKLLHLAGAIRMQEAIAESTGDSWLMVACVDRMVEMGEIREITQERCAGQHRIFVATTP